MSDLSFGLADAATLREATLGLRMGDYEGLSEATRVKIESHNADVGGLVKMLEKLEAAPADVMRAIEGERFGDAFGAVDMARINKAEACQKLVAAWKRKGELSQACYAELLALVPAAEVEYARAVEKVKADLTAIGSGVESYLAYSTHPEIAAQQFDWDARNRNSRSQTAAAKLSDVRAQVEGAAEHRNAAARGLDKARKFIKTLARKMVSA